MAKLHELLAVDSSLKGQAQKCRLELQNTFEKKTHLFQEKLVTFIPNEEGKEAETREQSDIQTTVRKEVTWLTNILVKSLDASYAIDMANVQAKADIVLEDLTEPLAKDVPATALLQLEKRLKEVQEFIVSIKTLDPALGFTQDETREKGIYAARVRVDASTKKEQRPLVLFPATDKHPAQTQLITEDVKIGVVRKQEWSSLLTPADKALLLERVEALTRAVAKARSRANEQDVDVKTTKIGKVLLDYVFQPLA